MISLAPSEFVQSFIQLKGRPFSFDGYEFFRRPYDTEARGLVLICARQTSKSTTISNMLVMHSCTRPYFSSLYVSVTENQVSIFSKQKLSPVLHSPFIKKHFFTEGKTSQAFYKQFTNHSDIIMRSCFLDAESIRGISTDLICIDEVQDILAENISVILETYTRSEHKYSVFAGTPKTNQHATQYYWDLSTKNEWLIRCTGCNYWNYLDEGCVQPQGLSCVKCGKLLDRHSGEWVSYDTTSKNRLDGYRVSQLATPWVPWDLDEAVKLYGDTADEQGTIMYKHRHYPKMRFHNEVLGLPYDNALCPISLNDLISACDPDMPMAKSRSDNSVIGSMRLFAGLDHSTSIDSASYTVLTIGGFVPGDKLVVVYAKRYEGIETDLNVLLADLIKKIKHFKVEILFADWGSGADKNKLLRDALAPEGIQVVELNHSGNQKADVNWNAKAKIFMINRTRIMSEVFNNVKYKNIVFPRWMEMQPFLSDLLNIYLDYNEVLRTVYYNHAPNKPDDFMHSLCFLWVGATQLRMM